MFGGWSVHTLDAKGRLAIPARFRNVLKAEADQRLVITTAEKCLVCYPNEQWQQITAKVSKLSLFNTSVQAFRRFYISGATEVNCDKQGRVLIPPALREMAGLDGQVLLAGMQSNFEIWDKKRFYEDREQTRVNFGDLSTAMAELGI